MNVWASNLQSEGKFGEIEQLILLAAFGEYAAQIAGGIPMSQVEIIRPDALGISRADIRKYEDAVADVIAEGTSEYVKQRLADLIEAAQGATTYGASGLDETHAEIAEQMKTFSDAEVVPHAHEWHLKNEYIPLETYKNLADLGVFSISLPEEYGGMGLGKLAMCVVSEELSRGYIGVGSLGTRAEIAGELILHNGTPEQKAKYLPAIAAGEMLPTAVFTEPNTGSDLASLKTRAVKDGDVWKITGQKTWITHPVRADVMTVLARTNPNEKGYKGLSMFLAEKPRGTDENPFPAKGMTGGEIEVLGYRGMKEYDISFDALRGAGREPARRGRGSGLQAADGDVRRCPHPDGRACRRRGAVRDGSCAEVCARSRAVRQPDLQVPARFEQGRDDGGRNHDRAPADLFRGA